jgi:hypothetical protein
MIKYAKNWDGNITVNSGYFLIHTGLTGGEEEKL